MNYLQRKRYALMMNRKFKGNLRTSSGNPITLESCQNEYPAIISVSGNTYQGNPDDNCIDILDVYDNPDGTLYNQYKYKYIKLKPNTAYTLSTNAPVTEMSSGTKAGLFYIFSGKNTATWLWSFTRAGVASENAPATWCTDSEGYLTIMILTTGGNINCTRENLLDGTYWVMLNEGETALEYKPYTALSSTNPQELQSCGDMTINLADQANVCRGASDAAYPNRTSAGYILDNSINRISGMPCRIEQGKTYTCSYNTEYITGDLSCSVFYIKNPEEGLMQYLQNGKSFVANFDATFLGIYVALGEGETNPNTGEPTPLNQIRISEVMLNEGDTALPYEPYGHYKIPVEQSGNLFNLRDTTAGQNGYTFFSLDEEDYISLERDNSSTTGTTYNAYYTEPSSKIKPSRLYTMFVEVKELSNCTLSAVSSSSLSWAGQFKVGKSITSAGTYKITAVSRENLADCKTMLRTEVSTPAGKIGKAVFRISIFEGELPIEVEDFVYQPYCDEVKKYNIYVPKQLCGGENHQKVFSSDIITLDIPKRSAILTKKFVDFTIDANTNGIWCTHQYAVLGKEVCCFRIPMGSSAMVNGNPKMYGTVVCSRFSGKKGSPWISNVDMANKMTERMLSLGSESGIDFSINYDTIGFPLYEGVESLPQDAADGQLARVNVDGDYLWYKYSEADGTWVESEYVIGVKGDTTFKTAMETAFKAWRTDNDITIKGYYELNDYVNTDISDVQDWDSISKLNTGINIITIESTERPSDVEVKYYTN